MRFLQTQYLWTRQKETNLIRMVGYAYLVIIPGSQVITGSSFKVQVHFKRVEGITYCDYVQRQKALTPYNYSKGLKKQNTLCPRKEAIGVLSSKNFAIYYMFLWKFKVIKQMSGYQSASLRKHKVLTYLRKSYEESNVFHQIP